MKPFGLQVILDHRKRLEDIAQQRLVDAKKVLETIKAKLQLEKINLSDLIDQTEKLQKEGIGIIDLIRYEDRITAQKQNILSIEKNVADKNQQVEAEQQHLVHCSQQRQILEQLKETQNRAWIQYLNKKEQTMLDEIAITRHQPDVF